jgi:hypothetical protein
MEPAQRGMKRAETVPAFDHARKNDLNAMAFGDRADGRGRTRPPSTPTRTPES